MATYSAAGVAPGEGAGLVDFHSHAMPPWLPDLDAVQPWDRWPSVQQLSETAARISVGGKSYRDIDDRCWSAQRRLSDMDRDGVAVQVISPIPIALCHAAPPRGAAVLATALNDFLVELVGACPERFHALGAVPMRQPEAAVAELRRCVTELGFLGVEIGTRVGDRELGDPILEPFFAAAEQLGALVFVHPVDDTLDPRVLELGVAFGAGMPSETGVAASALLTGDLLIRHPRLRLCLAHGGGTLPWLLPRLDKGALLNEPGRPSERMPSTLARQLFSDSLTYDVDSLLLAVRRFGTGNVVLGSDYPFAARESPIGAVLAELHDAELRVAIGGQNARRIAAQATAATPSVAAVRGSSAAGRR